jgi:hypothetical protein
VTVTGSGAQPAAAFTIFELWNGTVLRANAEPFNGSLGPNETPTIVIPRIQEARRRGMTVILSLTGGNHSRYLSPCTQSDCTSHDPDATQDSIFDLSKWTTVLNSFNVSGIPDTIAKAVAEGVVLGFIMVDEPHHFSWGGHTSTGGYFNKAKLNAMADQVHVIFPTLPVGVGQGGQHSWRAAERYTTLDFVMYQYSQFRNGKNVTAFRDSSLSQAGSDGVVPVLGVNLLDGGNRIPGCPTPETGGQGTFGDGPTAGWTGNCRMTAAQVRAAADTILKVNGVGRRAAGFSGWKYDGSMMVNYKATFFEVRQMVDALPARSYKRGS